MTQRLVFQKRLGILRLSGLQEAKIDSRFFSPRGGARLCCLLLIAIPLFGHLARAIKTALQLGELSGFTQCRDISFAEQP